MVVVRTGTGRYWQRKSCHGIGRRFSIFQNFLEKTVLYERLLYDFSVVIFSLPLGSF